MRSFNNVYKQCLLIKGAMYPTLFGTRKTVLIKIIVEDPEVSRESFVEIKEKFST